jgi:hypothetical protein
MSEHATHDPELVAAYAAGDASGSDLVAAEGLVAGCTECAALHRDLRAIMTALPRLPMPARTRDFRLTQAQADAIGPSRLRRLLAPLAGARFAFAGPAGAGLAALGLAGILLSGGLNVQPPGASTATTAGDKSTAAGAAATDPGTGGVTSAAGGPASDASMAPVPPQVVPSAAASVEMAQPAPSSVASEPPRLAAATHASSAPSPAASPDAFVLPATPAPTHEDVAAVPNIAPVPPAASGPSPVVVLSGVLLAVGGVLVLLRVGARRLARAPYRG